MIKVMQKIWFVQVVCLCLLCSTLLIPTLAEPVGQESENDNVMVLSYHFSHPTIAISSDFEHSYCVNIEGLPNSNEYFQTRVPVKPLTILLPYGKAVKTIEVRCPETQVIGPIEALEYGGAVIPLSEQIPTGASSSESRLFSSPSSLVSHQTEWYELVGTYLLRGYSLVHLNLYPIVYTQESQQIVFCPIINVVITLADTDTHPIRRECVQDIALVRSYVDNPEQLLTYTAGELYPSSGDAQYDYVIITNNKLKNAQGAYTFQDLVVSKQSKGLNATIVTVEEITANPDFSVDGKWGDNNPENPFYLTPLLAESSLYDDTEARIRNFIRFAYAEWGSDYVLLAGDADANHPQENIIPVRGLFADENGLPLEQGVSLEMDDIPSDVYYACLDGNFNYDGDVHFGEAPVFNGVDDTIDEADLYAEVNIGRACVDSEEEVSNFVKKAITYDHLFYDDYFSKVLFLGEYIGSQFYYTWGGDYKDDVEYLFPEAYNITKLYDRDDTFDLDYYWYLLNENPPLIINHDGHGSPSSAMKLNCRGIEELENDHYFFIYSHTCLAGAFDNLWPPDHYYELDCVAEYFTVETEHGAIGVIMNSRYGLGSQFSAESPSGAYDTSFFTAVFNHSIRQLGPANHYSKQDHIWRINENGMRWACYETNLLGDPELSLKKPVPELEVSVNLTIPIDAGCVYVNDKAPILISFLKNPLVLGGLTLQAEAHTVPDQMLESISFVIDHEVLYTADQVPAHFFWTPTSWGRHTISVIAHARYGFTVSENRTVVSIGI